MTPRIERTVKKAVDFVRIAPVGEATFAIGLFLGFSTIYSSRNFAELITPCVASIGIVGPGIGKTMIQLELYRRLKRQVEENGYNDRYFERTLRSWCNQQTAMVVAREAGRLDDYRRLMKAHPNTSPIERIIPHF